MRAGPREPLSQRGLFLVNLKLGRGSNLLMSSTLAGAYVSAYVAADDHDSATRLAIARLTAKGFEFQSTQGPVTRIDPDDWSRHVTQSWPEFIDELPKQEELAAGLDRELVFFGPFVGY